MKHFHKQSDRVLRGLAATLAGVGLAMVAVPARGADEPRKERGEERREIPPGRAEGERVREGKRSPDEVRRDLERRREAEGRPAEGVRREEARDDKAREGVRREGDNVRREGESRRDADGRKEIRGEPVRREGEGRRDVRGEPVRREGEPRRDGEVRREGDIPREAEMRRVPRPEEGRGGPFGLDLSEDQRRAVHEAMQGSMGELQGLMEKNRQARMSLEEAALAEKADIEVVERRARTVGEIEARIAMVRARALARIRPHLMAEQFERLKHSPMFGGMPPGPPAMRGEGREGDGRFGDGRGPRPEGREDVRRPTPDRERREGEGRPAPRGESERRDVPARETEFRERPRGDREGNGRREEAPVRRDGDREPERRPVPR